MQFIWTTILHQSIINWKQYLINSFEQPFYINSLIIENNSYVINLNSFLYQSINENSS